MDHTKKRKIQRKPLAAERRDVLSEQKVSMVGIG